MSPTTGPTVGREPAAGSLGALVGATGVPAFGAERWARDAFWRAAADGSDLSTLFSLQDADELLSTRGLRTPFVRVAKDGVVQAESRYARSAGVGASVRDQVDPDRVARLLADGCTVVFQGLHRIWPALVTFTTTLTRELGHPVQVNAYLTPPSARGFAPHYDTHDVFVVQTAGDKRWQVHSPVVDPPAPGDGWTGHREAVGRAAETDPVLDQVLSPGDVLYLPRGWIHSAQAQQAMSLHLTIGVHPYTRRHLVEALVAEILDDQPLDESLALGIDVADAVDLAVPLATVRDLMASGLAAATAPRIAARMERRLAEDTRPPPLRPIVQASAALAASLDPVAGAAPVAPVVVARPGARLRLQEDVDGVTLVADGRPLQFGPEHAAALKAIVEGVPSESEALPGLEPLAGRALVRQLLLEGAVVPA